MAFKPNNPGCPGCNCDVLRFYETDYDILPDNYGIQHTGLRTGGFDRFAIAEGAASGTGYLLDAGERLQTNPHWLWCAKAWFHEIDLFDGDADITWDGGTIEFRHAAGTISVNGSTAEVMPPTARLAITRLVLYVTESWYMVCCIRYKDTAISPSTWEASRSSIQVFDRVTDTTQRTVTLEGVGGDTSLRAWVIADATVKTSGDYLGDYFAEYLADDPASWQIKKECRRPNIPTHTEAQYQAQRAGTTTYLGFTHPDTMTLPVAPTVEMYQFCFGFPPVTSTYSGPLAAGFLITAPFNQNYVWTDQPGIGFTSGVDGIISSFEDGRGANVLSIVSDTITNCAGTFRVVMSIDFGTAMFWALPTGTDPYPKPVIRHKISSSFPITQPDVTADVVPNGLGVAAATLSANYLRTPPGSGNYLIYTDVTIQWVAS